MLRMVDVLAQFSRSHVAQCGRGSVCRISEQHSKTSVSQTCLTPFSFRQSKIAHLIPAVGILRVATAKLVCFAVEELPGVGTRGNNGVVRLLLRHCPVANHILHVLGRQAAVFNGMRVFFGGAR